MKRPSQKLLKDMSSGELAAEAAWHEREAAWLFSQAREIRAEALKADRSHADELLHRAFEMEKEADAHVRQSNVLGSLRAMRLPLQGSRVVARAVQA